MPCPPAPHLQHRHLPNQQLRLHPGNNCLRGCRRLRSTSLARAGRRPRPTVSKATFTFQLELGASWSPPPTLTTRTAPRIPASRSGSSQAKNVLHRSVSVGVGASLPSKSAARGGRTRSHFPSFLFNSSQCPPPHSTWGALEYTVVSVKSPSFKGMRASILGLGPTPTQLIAPQAPRSQPGATSVCASQGL